MGDQPATSIEHHDDHAQVARVELRPLLSPVPNYTLSDVCPNCGVPVVRRACKVRCERCNFMWDCSEL